MVAVDVGFVMILVGERLGASIRMFGEFRGLSLAVSRGGMEKFGILLGF